MSSIAARLRMLVVERAKQQCEYCGLAQVGQEATFHIDHIVPRIAGGATTAANLALACVSCSLRKEAMADVSSRLNFDDTRPSIPSNDAPQWHQMHGEQSHRCHSDSPLTNRSLRCPPPKINFSRQDQKLRRDDGSDTELARNLKTILSGNSIRSE